MSEWKKVKLGEILQVKKGDYITKKEAREGIYPVILGGKEPAYFIDKYNHTGKAIVISRSGASAGYVSFWNEPIFVTDGFLIEPKDNITYEFLFYALRSKQAYLHKSQKGAAIPHVTPLLIGDIDFSLPDSPTQYRIAGILSRYDTLIENYQKQIKLLEEAAQRLYKEWFVDLRFPGYENTKIADGVPEGWRYYRIDERYKTVLGGTPSRAKSNYWGGCIPWINSGEINKLRIIAGSEMITQEGYDNSSTKLMPIHTTILAITGATLGQVSYTEIETCANQSVVGIIDESNQTNEYLYLNISNNILSIVNKATGGAQQHINKDIVNDYPILMPDDKILAVFKGVVSPIFNLMKDMLLSIESLAEARDRLLPKLMNGEIAV